jgi:protein O-mannosyl-transferase
MTDSHKTLVYRLVFLSVMILAVYGNTLNDQLVWDDISIIVDNPLLEKLSNIPKFFISEDRFGDPTGYYRPITYVSFAIERAIWGLNPVGFNITNLVLHIAVTCFFYLAVSALFKKEQLAFVAALLFSLHPIAGETVNFNAGGRNTLICACFALLSLYFYIRKRHIPAVLCFTVAIFSKEFAILLPVIFFIYDRYINEERTKWIYYVPYLASITLYLTARSFAVEKANFLQDIKISNDLLVAPYIVVKYLINMVFPIGLKTLNDVYISRYIGFFCILLVFAIISIAVIYREKKELAFSVCWFLLFLFPVINLIPLPSATLLADRYAYFSLMGFSLFLAYFICKCKLQTVIQIMIVFCSFYAVTDILQNDVWKDEPSLYSKMIKDAPEKALGYHNLGRFYYKNGDLSNAIKYLAIACTKEDVNSRMLGADALVFWEADRLDIAATLLLKKLQITPDDPQSYIMLNRIYEKMGNKTLAKTYHDRAVALFPKIEEFMTQRVLSVCREGEKLMAEHKYDKAENLFREALGINPDFIPALIDMGNLSAEKQDMAGALKYFTKAVALDPLNPSTHHNLSITYELMGRPAEAQEEMKKFRELDLEAKQK